MKDMARNGKCLKRLGVRRGLWVIEERFIYRRGDILCVKGWVEMCLIVKEIWYFGGDIIRVKSWWCGRVWKVLEVMCSLLLRVSDVR